MNTSLLEAVLTAAERGWHVFPLTPGGKTPAVKRWEQRATTDPERIRRCWATGVFNIGIACGPPRLVVVDLDRPKPGQRPPDHWRTEGVNDGADVLAALAEQAGQEFPVCTYAVSTASGGLHLYYQHPVSGPQLRNTAGQLGWLIDTRAAGGYVIAAGSRIGQRGYTIAWGEELAPAPVARMARQTTPARAPAASATGDRPPGS